MRNQDGIWMVLMKQTDNETMPDSLTFEQIDALLALIEFHDDWDEVSERVGTNVALLHDILTEFRDAAWCLTPTLSLVTL